MRQYSFVVCKKIGTVLLVILLILSVFPLTGIVNFALAANMTDGLRLQTKVDLTPSGGTLILDRDYSGQRNGWGYSETVTLRKPITIKGQAPTNRAQIDNIRFDVQAKNVTLKNLRVERGDSPHGLFLYVSSKTAVNSASPCAV